MEKVRFTKIVDNSKSFPTVYRTFKSEVYRKSYVQKNTGRDLQSKRRGAQTASHGYVPVKRRYVPAVRVSKWLGRQKHTGTYL